MHTEEMISLQMLKTPTTTMADGLLVQLTIAGDQRAFEILVQRYSTPLFNFICHFLNDYDQGHDILQQVFLRFYMTLPKLDTNDSFKPWLFQVARNCCVDELRRRKRHAIQFSQLETEDNENEFSIINEIPDTNPSLDELMEHRDLQRQLQSAIQSLPPKFRAVVVLRYASQLSFSEIGRTLSMPEATAKTYFHRAKLLLRKILSPQIAMGVA
jgi:RNA polymerase sigma factor (sigma-70 family)